MPNWTTNMVVISCSQSVRPDIIEALTGYDREQQCDIVFDFNKLIPMPEHSDDFQAHGNLGHDVIHSGKPRTNDNNWYEWSSRNWGTKWPACDAEITEETDTEIHYRFLTAWDAPRPIVDALRKKMSEDFGATVEWECVHEDGAEEETL